MSGAWSSGFEILVLVFGIWGLGLGLQRLDWVLIGTLVGMG